LPTNIIRDLWSNVDDAEKDFTVESFFFGAAAAYSQLFCELLGKYLLVSELHVADIII